MKCSKCNKDASFSREIDGIIEYRCSDHQFHMTNKKEIRKERREKKKSWSSN